MKDAIRQAATAFAARFPIARKLPEPIRAALRRWLAQNEENLSKPEADLDRPSAESDYAARLDQEREIFKDQLEVNDLPAIFHYWSNTHLRPQFERFGFSNPDQFFANVLEQAFLDSTDRPARFASIGCGNCDTEVRVASLLVERGITDFTLECLDLNASMLERGKSLAHEAGLERQILPRQIDFNNWSPTAETYAAIIANQSLHHVLALERLFTDINHALSAQGRFATSDMIGRNGHMRWPEAMDIIHEYWNELPASHRWNTQLRRHEELYEFWDCSGEGFEGIRAQDILPLLIERFDFEFFFAFGNLVDPFIDRSFGPHFDADSAIDRDLIDRIEARDQLEIRAGRIKPTHIIATMRKKPYTGSLLTDPDLPPAFCVRDTSA